MGILDKVGPGEGWMDGTAEGRILDGSAVGGIEGFRDGNLEDGTAEGIGAV